MTLQLSPHVNFGYCVISFATPRRYLQWDYIYNHVLGGVCMICSQLQNKKLMYKLFFLILFTCLKMYISKFVL